MNRPWDKEHHDPVYLQPGQSCPLPEGFQDLGLKQLTLQSLTNSGEAGAPIAVLTVDYTERIYLGGTFAYQVVNPDQPRPKQLNRSLSITQMEGHDYGQLALCPGKESTTFRAVIEIKPHRGNEPSTFTVKILGEKPFHTPLTVFVSHLDDKGLCCSPQTQAEPDPDPGFG